MAAETTSSVPTYSGNALGVSPALASEIGGRLKAARITSGKSTRLIADTIKVREQYLSAIEDGRWDDLPRGLNGRGIVRNYARELLVPIPELEPSEIRNHMNSQVHPFEVSSVAAVQPQVPQTSNQRYARAPQPQRTIPRRPVEVTQPSFQQTTKTQYAKSNRSAFSDADDDTPLGIVTPDVAKILGLPTDTPVVKPVRENIQSAHEAPRVDAKEVISDLLKSDVASGMSQHSQKESKKEAKARERERRRLAAEAERLEAEAQLQQHAPRVVTSAPVQQAPNVVVVGDSQSTQESYATQVAAQHVTSHSVTETAPTANSVRATPDPSIPTLLVQEHQKEVANHQNRGQQMMFVAAAAVLIAATGAYFFIRQDHRVVESEESTSAAPTAPQIETSATAPVDTTATTSVAPDATNGLTTTAPTDATTTQTTAATDTTQAAPVPSTDALATTSSATTPTTTTTTATTATAPVTALSAPVTTTAAGVERTATLKLSGDVEMRIVIDDKVFFSGRKTAGEMPLKFKDKAEILVRDGSKVSLVYEGWDHGALGHEGRRRRIVLNAQSAD